jgi:hypothetical protein
VSKYIRSVWSGNGNRLEVEASGNGRSDQAKEGVTETCYTIPRTVKPTPRAMAA